MILYYDPMEQLNPEVVKRWKSQVSSIPIINIKESDFIKIEGTSKSCKHSLLIVVKIVDENSKEKENIVEDEESIAYEK